MCFYSIKFQIGGNAYVFKENSTDIDFELVAYPDEQLFVRWAQVTAFLPSMQYRYRKNNT